MRRRTALLLVLFALLCSLAGNGETAADTGGRRLVTPTDRQALMPNPIAAARRLLAAAGYPNGVGFPEIEILYNTSEAHKKIAAAIQFMWKRNLGIKVALRNTEWKTYLDRLSKLDYQVAEAARGRLQRVLTNDPGIGIARHADAGYETALQVAVKKGVDLGGR